MSKALVSLATTMMTITGLSMPATSVDLKDQVSGTAQCLDRVDHNAALKHLQLSLQNIAPTLRNPDGTMSDKPNRLYEFAMRQIIEEDLRLRTGETCIQAEPAKLETDPEKCAATANALQTEINNLITEAQKLTPVLEPAPGSGQSARPNPDYEKLMLKVIEAQSRLDRTKVCLRKTKGPSMAEAAVPACPTDNAQTLTERLTSLQAEVRAIPPLLPHVDPDGTASAVPNPEYEKVMLRVIETMGALEATKNCRQS